MADYFAMTEGHIMPTYRRGGGGRANIDGKTPVLGKIGSSAPKGYVQTGTTIKSNKAGEKTFAIYTPIDQVKETEETTTTDTDTSTDGGNDGGGGSGSSPGSDGGAAETINPYEGIEFPDYSDQFSGMNDAITGLSTTFTNELAKLTGKMAEDRKAAEDRMAEMQQSFQQSLAARKSKPRVSGIRFADRGTGGRSSSQLLRRGVRGTFGRSGERLMKISALNI
jgi:hypothetical protein